ncbi:MAG: hypothetical protein JST30_11895 [Armatimonadetes bacterium]|nr:hypothetical protein [Armatimonadota bacterium]
MILPFLALSLSVQQDLPEVKMGKGQLVFLIEPDGQWPKVGDPEELQAGHLKNLERLWSSRKALVVGPFAEPGKRKGLVVLDVETAKEAEEMLADDPWIKAGRLKLETHTWFFAKNYVKKGTAFMDLDDFWFGTLERPADVPKISDEEAKTVQAGHMANITSMAKSGALLIAGPMMEDGTLRGIFVFKDMERSKIDEMAAKDPAIKAGRLKLTLTKWKAQKGSFLLQPVP